MNSNPAIRISNLSKAYRIPHQQGHRPTNLAEAVMQRLKNPLGRGEVEEFWALKGIDLEITRGDVVGIIGRNGAGKSTLLKILSRITEPTSGRVELFGRVGSLLEVGTGFHPELTGRENIYLNGAILGMRRAEITRQFDAIVDFAGVEKFLDTPVKRYSSGMYVRLAFSVAAHLNPEILIVDEVLAVGDAEFQKKCLGKMQDVAESGRTVIFVSHNMVAMQKLCSHAVLLRQGQLINQGAIGEIARAYLDQMNNSAASDSTNSGAYVNRGRLVRIDRVELLVDGERANCVQSGARCSISIDYRTLQPTLEGLSISIVLFNDGRKMVNLWTNYLHPPIPISECGNVTCTIAKWPFRTGTMSADVFTHIGPETQDWIEDVLRFESHDGDFYGSGVIPNSDQGLLFLDHDWAHSLASKH